MRCVPPSTHRRAEVPLAVRFAARSWFRGSPSRPRWEADEDDQKTTEGDDGSDG